MYRVIVIAVLSTRIFNSSGLLAYTVEAPPPPRLNVYHPIPPSRIKYAPHPTPPRRIKYAQYFQGQPSRRVKPAPKLMNINEHDREIRKCESSLRTRKWHTRCRWLSVRLLPPSWWMVALPSEWSCTYRSGPTSERTDSQ